MKKHIKLTSWILYIALLCALFLSPFESTTKAATDYGLSNPRMSNGISTWDYIWFGNYWQSSETMKEPIKWRVLSVNGDDAFLLADQNLDCQPYNTEYTDVTWETCSLRTWLNSTFYQDAFSSEEQSAIRTTTVVNEDNPEYGTEGGNDTQDKVYLLSIAEASNAAYGFHSTFDAKSETRAAMNTAHVANANSYMTGAGENDAWWLRSPGSSHSAAYVWWNGWTDVNGLLVDYGHTAVRPALHIDLSSSTWSKAGTVISGEDDSKPSTSDISDFLDISNDQPVKDTTQNKTPSWAKVISSSVAAKPAKVKNLKTKNNKKRTVTLSWSKVKKADGYQVQYVKSGSFSKKNIYVKKNKVQVKKLKKKKKYSFRVRAYVLNGKKKKYGKWSSAKKVKIKK